MHELAAQHGWLRPPQPTHDPPEQTVPAAEHELPLQHVCPAPPQATQDPPEQTVPAAEHEFPAQHCWPAPPQATHWLVVEQSDVDEHLLVPVQHGWPALPQRTQLLFVPQIEPTLQLIDAQQTWVFAPHGAHFPLEQR